MARISPKRIGRRRGHTSTGGTPILLWTFIAMALFIACVFMFASSAIDAAAENVEPVHLQTHPFISDHNDIDNTQEKQEEHIHTHYVPPTNDVHEIHDVKEEMNEEEPLASDILDPSLEHRMNNDGEPYYHIVFSTDCSSFQKWQSYLLFYSAMKAKQPGSVTRIASGCTDEEEEEEQKFQDMISQTMSPHFKVHFTPHFSKVKDENGNETGKDYKFFNKPFGLLHWIEHSEENLNNSDIVILLDPDQILTRPITNDFSDLQANVLPDKEPKTKVQHGSPFAQKYGFGASWLKLDVETITQDPNTPARISNPEAGKHYPAGPPYLATVKDFHLIAKHWAEFVPRVHKEHPHLMAEMYAFCIAAAHVKLPFQMVASLMVSNIGMGPRDEGWGLLTNVPDQDICSKDIMSKYPLPSVLHYCQRYIVGKHFYGKRRMPKDIFTCSQPLLLQPPDDIHLKYDYFVPPHGTHGEDENKSLSKEGARRNAFMICALTRLTNEAALFYQKHHCETKKDENIALDMWSLNKIMTSSL